MSKKIAIEVGVITKNIYQPSHNVANTLSLKLTIASSHTPEFHKISLKYPPKIFEDVMKWFQDNLLSMWGESPCDGAWEGDSTLKHPSS